MSEDFFGIRLSMPEYFYRDHRNDIDTNQLSNLLSNNTKRLINTGLPFLGLIKPLHQPLLCLCGVSRTITCLVDLRNSYVKNGCKLDIPTHLPKLISVAVSCTSVALAIIAPPAAVLLTTIQDIAYELMDYKKHLDSHNFKQAFESEINISNNGFYLALIMSSGTGIVHTSNIIFTIAALGYQTLIHIYRGEAEYQKGNHIETSGHVLMTLFRCIELKNQVYRLS